LLTSERHEVRAQTERLLLEQEFGKPRQQVEHSGEVATRFVVEAPVELTHDEWLARHSKVQSEIAAIADTEPVN
jgi:hypothetical protein